MRTAMLISKQNSQLKAYSQDMFSFLWSNSMETTGYICADTDIYHREPRFRRLRGNGL